MNRLQKIDWQDEWTRNRTDRQNLPAVIPHDYGVGVSFENKGFYSNEPTTYTSECKYPRRINVDIRSYAGISMGAVHYYAEIDVFDLSLCYMDRGKEEHGSIGGAFKRPPETEGMDITVMRKVTQADIKNGTIWDKERFKGYKIGDLVNTFDTEREAIYYAVSLIKARFTGDWVVDFCGICDDSELEDFLEGHFPLADLEKVLDFVKK